MAATPSGDFVLLATILGNAYLYDPLADDFVQGRSITATIPLGYIGPIAAGPRGQYFVVNGVVLNQALTPLNASAALAVSQVSSLVQAGGTTFAQSTQPPRPAAANTLPTTAPTVDLVDGTTGAVLRQATMLEGPQTALGAGLTRAAISGRTMAMVLAQRKAAFIVPLTVEQIGSS